MNTNLSTRRLAWPADMPTVFDVFASNPEQFAAILENPLGNGLQLLASKAGKSLCFSMESLATNRAGDTFRVWRESLQAPHGGSVDCQGIRCLVYAAYEAGGLAEQLPTPKGNLSGPLLWLHFPAWSISFAPDKQEVHLCSTGGKKELDYLETILIESRNNLIIKCKNNNYHSCFGVPDSYLRAVTRVKEYIAAGDIFQANIARYWHAPAPEENGIGLYARLRQVNPAPFSAYVNVETEDDRLQIISASPERLFRLHPNGLVETRPIAGTRQRGKGAEDQELSSELLLSEKERAEHIMLVDLERNDLGRVCVPGSVEVSEHMVIERYATVQHIVSNVQGKLEKGKDVVDVFRAMFPGGTITGCPKVRCMEIIHEMEERARGPYTGSIGYVGWDGSADMNILIRSFWLHKGTLNWAAGAGIVADSNPEFELKETDHKAEGLLRALHSH